MINFGFIIILSFILVYQNIIILNEETLILICFITFCLLAYTRLNNNIYNSLKDQSISIKNSLISSLDQLLKELVSNIKIQSKLKNLALDFKVLGDHFLNISFSLSNQLPTYIIKRHEKIYPKKLIFTHRLEQQTTKLLALLLSQKLGKIITLQRFYTYNFKISPFSCIDKIILREYFEII